MYGWAYTNYTHSRETSITRTPLGPQCSVYGGVTICDVVKAQMLIKGFLKGQTNGVLFKGGGCTLEVAHNSHFAVFLILKIVWKITNVYILFFSAWSTQCHCKLLSYYHNSDNHSTSKPKWCHSQLQDRADGFSRHHENSKHGISSYRVQHNRPEPLHWVQHIPPSGERCSCEFEIKQQFHSVSQNSRST